VDFFDRAIQLMEPEDDRLRSIRLQRAIAEQMAYHIADAENLRRARQAEG
jgi:hypothetical protein